MYKIPAIMSVTLRGAIRSRVVLALLAILCLVIGLLPVTIKGDGTLEGYMHVMLSYTLGFVRFLLAVASLWAGCAAVSMDVEEKQIQTVLTKPVHPFTLWLGKWLGLVALNAALLLFAGAFIYTHLRISTRPDTLLPEQRQMLNEQLMTARTVSTPQLPKFGATHRELLDQMEQQGQIQKSKDRRRAVSALERQYVAERFSVPPGETRVFTFPPLKHRDSSQSAYLEYRFNVSEVGTPEVAGEWMIFDEAGAPIFREWVRHKPLTQRAIRIPAEALPEDGPVKVHYRNAGAGATLFFDPTDSLDLLYTAGSFEMNFLRGLLVIWIYLAFISAVGVAAGSLFSMPVAAFCSVFLLLVTQMDNYIHEMAGQGTIIDQWRDSGGIAALMDRGFVWVFRGLDVLVAPLQSPSVMSLLTDGRLVSWRLVVSTALVKGMMYGGLLALIGAAVLRRRELARAGL